MSNDVLIQTQFWLSPVVSLRLFDKNSYDEKDDYQGHHKKMMRIALGLYLFFMFIRLLDRKTKPTTEIKEES